MTKSKSKTPRVGNNIQSRRFVAIHQNRLMEAFARGFLPVQDIPLLVEDKITASSIERAKGDETWGSVFLLEISSDVTDVGIPYLSQPVLLTDIVACWASSRDAVLDIEARLETFDDTVPTVLDIKVDASLFNSGSESIDEQMGLTFGSSDIAASSAVNANTIERLSIDPVSLEKLAGAISSIGSYARRNTLPIAQTCNLLSLPEDPNAHYASDAIHRLARHVYRVVRPSQNGSSDERIYVAAATMLGQVSTKDGIDPINFVEKLLANDSQLSAPGAEAEVFLETLRKILDNKIELSNSKIDDTGMIGQRALMIFLLAPRFEQLERWISARPVGRSVEILARILSGLYCGLGGISRESKAVTRGAFLGAIAAARLAMKGFSLQVNSFQSWDENATLIERISLAGYEFFNRTSPASRLYLELLHQLRVNGVFEGVDSSSGVARASLGNKNFIVLVQVGESRFCLPVAPVIQLSLKTKSKKRGQFSRELLLGLLDKSLWPVMSSVDLISGEIMLEVEVVPGNDISKGLAAIYSAANLLDLVAIEESKIKPKKSAKKSQDTTIG